MNILSIQSHVAFGYVGNRAAVFPLQRLGHDVTVINTVQFSNHTGYGSWEGDVFSLDHIQRLVKGLEDRKALQGLDALLTGYMGDAALGNIFLDILKKIRQHHPEIIYCLDPVIGDVGRGIFVREGIGEFFRDHLIHEATIITPNQFELSYLTGLEVNTLSDVKKACKKLQEKGPKIILVTSLIHRETKGNTLGMLVYYEDKAWLIETPLLPLSPAPNGAGDATAALFLAHYLSSKDPVDALEKTTAAVFSIFEYTLKAHTRELQLIAAQDSFKNPEIFFRAREV